MRVWNENLFTKLQLYTISNLFADNVWCLFYSKVRSVVIMNWEAGISSAADTDTRTNVPLTTSEREICHTNWTFSSAAVSNKSNISRFIPRLSQKCWLTVELSVKGEGEYTLFCQIVTGQSVGWWAGCRDTNDPWILVNMKYKEVVPVSAVRVSLSITRWRGRGN